MLVQIDPKDPYLFCSTEAASFSVQRPSLNIPANTVGTNFSLQSNVQADTGILITAFALANQVAPEPIPKSPKAISLVHDLVLRFNSRDERPFSVYSRNTDTVYLSTSIPDFRVLVRAVYQDIHILNYPQTTQADRMEAVRQLDEVIALMIAAKKQFAV